MFSRAEDDDYTRVVDVEHDEVKVHDAPSDVSGNPSNRRDGMAVQFYCETCPSRPKLAIYQHKGTTYVGWTHA